MFRFFSREKEKEKEKATEDKQMQTENEKEPVFKEDKEKDHTIYTWDDTVPFVAPVSTGQVIKVYDGDTITIAAKLPIPNSPLYRFAVRLSGIDAPEIKGKDDDEKEAALEAKKVLSSLILHKTVVLKNVDNEKYGRLLADVYCDDLFVNEYLLKECYVVEYGGKTKEPPTSWKHYRLTGERK